jgi:hypothetical protein
MNPGRNDPCPCGSGKKYKKCCELTVRPVVDPDAVRANAAKDADRRLTERMLRFARMRTGTQWLPAAFEMYTDGTDEEIADAELQLAVPWAMFSVAAAIGELSLAQTFREEHASRLPLEIREVLDAQLSAWLTVWDVRRVERGVGVQVTDLLSGEERFVHEISASATLSVRDVLLGRVVDIGGISFFGGMHPSPLGPADADVVVREIRRLCHVRTRPVVPERLRLPTIELALITVWRGVVEQRNTRPAPRLTNTDGEPVLLTTDHFDVLVRDRSMLLARLSAIAGAEEPEVSDSDRNETTITITKPGNAKMKSWDNTIIGRIVIKGNRMRIESNSTRRADMLRASLTEHLGQLVRYRIRDETSQEELVRQASEPREPKFAAPVSSPESAAIMKEFKERYMLDWLDEEIPALGGLTPREAARSPRSRKSLELLLRDFENHEGRLPESERFDVDRLRTALRVEDRKRPAT